MMKATPKFDKKIGEWVIYIKTEEGEIIPVGRKINGNKKINLWEIATWDTKKKAENWIKVRCDKLLLGY